MTDPTEATHESTEAPAPVGELPPAKETASAEIVQGEGITAPPAAEIAVLAPEPPIAPDVPRIERPAGTSRAIPETMLGPRPSPSFLAVVSIVSLASDIITKLWAEKRLEGYPGYINVSENHLMFVLAKNKGGAWGLLQGQSENVRRPFFLLVSVAAIAFIVTLYRRLQPRQHALKWGLPLVLGGALGNVFDRIRYGYVIDFIDYRADWIKKLNELVQKKYPAHIVTDHWPTFNVADIAICVGVALMAIDMLTSRRGKKTPLTADVPVQPPEPAQPVQPAEPAEPAEPAQPAQPSTGAEVPLLVGEAHEPALAAEASAGATATSTTATSTETEPKTAEPT